MIRKAKAIWQGTGREGNGHLFTDSGVLAETPYSFKTRFENEKGTNPEELLAAAHAGCFTMALAFRLQRAGYTPTELNTEAAVTLECLVARALVAFLGAASADDVSANAATSATSRHVIVFRIIKRSPPEKCRAKDRGKRRGRSRSRS